MYLASCYYMYLIVRSQIYMYSYLPRSAFLSFSLSLLLGTSGHLHISHGEGSFFLRARAVSARLSGPAHATHITCAM